MQVATGNCGQTMRDEMSKNRTNSEQPDFPPLAQFEPDLDPHTFCVGGSFCKQCQTVHKVHFSDPTPPHSDDGVRVGGDMGLLNEEISTTTESSDGEQCENRFDALKSGHDIELSTASRVARRSAPIGGSRLVVGHLGACSGQVIWRVKIDRCGIDHAAQHAHNPNPNPELESAIRMKRQNVHGIKIGVAQKGANLKWFAGFDKHSFGLDWQGDLWTEGKPIKTHLIDGGGRRGVCFKEGDVVSVIVEFNSEKPTLKYAVNDVPLPGAYYLSTFKPNQDLFVAVSLLWPGEQVTFASEELYE
eukprot:CAMPEP_0202810782 /NCGR_PEP_ID=MMETSP1389-20130828/2800_1 /ASSEMBLY_ACC=CAM_ASM_000865 /TAXON_ID=302021 /ORGANISM="Rhodomonas sp., Strain CCMP768" /LENGTH=301 /DNA_ID=CAMNT_0049481747 /DNA_START=9 /DNA_END=914 /DNA_ORIENTATION=-